MDIDPNSTSTVSYMLGCKECLKGDSAGHTFFVDQEDEENLKAKSEYGVEKWIKRLLLEEGKKCKYCGSSRLDVYEVKINTKKLYDFQAIVEECKRSEKNIIIFKISKSEGDTKAQVRGSNQFGEKFAECALNVAINEVKSINRYEFIYKSRGKFIMVITGPDRKDTWDDDLTIERVRNVGMSFDEVKHGMIDIASRFGMHIEP